MDTLATAARRLLLLDDAIRHDHRRAHAAAASPPAPGPEPEPEPRASFPKLLPVFILFVLLLCFLSIFLLRDLLHFFSLWLRRRRRLRDSAGAADSDDAGPDAAAQGPTKPAGLDPAVLATFPTSRFEATDAAAAPECAVCLSEFASGDAVRLLTVCRHAFHVACIDSWLAAHTTCPVCRCQLDAPGHAAVRQQHGGDGGRIAVVVDHGAGAGFASHDNRGARSQFDR